MGSQANTRSWIEQDWTDMDWSQFLTPEALSNEFNTPTIDTSTATNISTTPQSFVPNGFNLWNSEPLPPALPVMPYPQSFEFNVLEPWTSQQPAAFTVPYTQSFEPNEFNPWTNHQPPAIPITNPTPRISAPKTSPTTASTASIPAEQPSNTRRKAQAPEPTPTNPKKPKAAGTISDEDAKRRHIESEKRRLDRIRRNLEDLCGIVPSLEIKDAKTRVKVFNESATYAQELVQRREKLNAALWALGINPEDALRSMPEGPVNAPPAAPATFNDSNTAPATFYPMDQQWFGQ